MIIHQVPNSRGNYNYNAFIYTNMQWYSHFHKNFEVIYSICGTVDVVINGIKFTLKQGELILVSPYTIHSINIPKNTKSWVGVFAEDYIQSFAKKYGTLQYQPFRCKNNIEEFLKEYLFFEGTPEQFLSKACLYMICSECLKESTPINFDAPPDFKENCIIYLSKNLSNSISLSEIAEALGYEYHYFSTLFHKCFEINFKAFVNIFRISLACDLLSDKKHSISYISGECGFQSIRNFNRVFKALTGKTPNEYRNLK